ncbi:hypothetical protein [Psychrosphaera algicola]|uniref:Uncharacterized protein n=1 Tax=Psychrosphaera algicola TaxID=3023714 RepID=A0ABT5FGR0_9GAMM|nr:hypothetical protein [Psychrosphaera sp. G1-22]MDC2890484.1 hypothetical protein [Psychrosphaera sp. G1-22]
MPISAKRNQRFSEKHLNIDEMLMVVVGDAKVLKPQLEALNYKVIDFKL